MKRVQFVIVSLLFLGFLAGCSLPVNLPSTYTVTYNGNGGRGDAPTDGTKYQQEAPVTVLGPGTLVRTSYVFAGWNTQANGGGTTYTQGQTFPMGTASVILYAIWTQYHAYGLTYMANGASGGSVPTDSNNYLQGQTVTVMGNTGALVRTSYAFAGWNTQPSGGGGTYTQGQTFPMGTASVTLYAIWTQNTTYSVTYMANGASGGSVPTDSNNYLQGQTATVMGNTGVLVRTSYAFAGWNTQASGSGATYAAGVTFPMGASNVTLYAVWTQNPTYTVMYNGNGGSGSVPTDSNNYLPGATVTVLGSGSLVRTSYAFAGWNAQASGSGAAYSTGATFPMGASNVTLYAMWLPTYTVTYLANGATSGSVPTDSNHYQQAATVTVLGNSGNLVSTGYTFAGWNTQPSGSGNTYTQGQTFPMGSANVTLYAILVPTYTVTYNGNGGSGGVPTDDSNYLSGATVTVLGSGSLVRASYAFAGWNTQAGGGGATYTSGATFPMSASNVTLYAMWLQTYTVTYAANGATGGSVPTDSNHYQQGATVTVSGNTGALVSTGYTFAGWNTQVSGGGNTYTQGQTFPMGTANETLYAIWVPTYTVTYNGNGSTGGSVPTDNNNYLPGATVAVMGSGSLVRTGYTFTGWNTLANGSGTTETLGQTFSMGTSRVSLYAVWVLSTYTVTYNGNGSNGGSVTDGNNYLQGAMVTVLGSGTLASTGNTFAAWNTMADGSGTNFAAGAAFPMGSANMTLYAVWIPDNFQFSSSGASITITGSNPTSGSLTIPGGVTSIGSIAFINSIGLTGITLPSSLTSIGSYAFENCTSLTSIAIPSGVTSVGQGAFYGDSGMASVTVQAITPAALPSGSQAFSGCAAGLQIHVPSGTVSTYQVAAGWSDFAAQITSP